MVHRGCNKCDRKCRIQCDGGCTTGSGHGPEVTTGRFIDGIPEPADVHVVLWGRLGEHISVIYGDREIFGRCEVIGLTGDSHRPTRVVHLISDQDPEEPCAMT